MSEQISKLTLTVDTSDAERALKGLQAVAQETANTLSGIEVSAAASLERSILRLTEEIQDLHDLLKHQHRERMARARDQDPA